MSIIDTRLPIIYYKVRHSNLFIVMYTFLVLCAECFHLLVFHVLPKSISQSISQYNYTSSHTVAFLMHDDCLPLSTVLHYDWLL